MPFEKLCEVNELTEGKGREFVVGARIVAAFRVGSEVFAVEGMCAHQGGPLAQGNLDGKCITCPWHGWQYNVGDGTNLLTGKRMLDCFAIELRDGEVWIDVERSANSDNSTRVE